MIRYFSVLFLIIIASCNTSKKIIETPVLYDEQLLDTLFVVAPKMAEDDFSFQLETYNPSYTRTFDLIHTKLNLSFNWEKQHVLGSADLHLTPLFYPSDKLNLDAKGFDIHGVYHSVTKLPLQYQYDGYILSINLNKTYQSTENVFVTIDYTAKPNEGPPGGSQAITSDKGLFFINPLGNEENKPQQIWTQGETENNSRWFPTIDKPNERCTQEIYLTVEQKFATLSNGTLVNSTKNTDGTRTDYWKLDKPHAPYLFMLAIGDFAVVNDQWENIPLSYYVDKEYEAYAAQIFNHTPEMLTFFSEYLDIKYPWDKYAQVIVEDFVSGAMENTTAVIFGDFVQKTDRELIDNHNDDIVAHEMFHHWFGNYVTCESWANLTLNEGFANYSEYLWTEYKYGKDAADKKRMDELSGYLGSAQNGGTHDLIDFGYDDKEEMFDAHSYNKGGLVLHMLRNYIGDDAFRAALNYYLTKHAWTDVEAHELRMAFEDVTGQDLNWFFNQWFFDKGHPELEVQHFYENDTYTLKVIQTQSPEDNAAIFQLPLAVDIYTDSGVRREKIFIKERTQSFDFTVKEMPSLVNFDADNVLLGTIAETLRFDEYVFQYYNAPLFQDRFDALIVLMGEEKAQKLFVDALEDPFHVIRGLAVTEVFLTNKKVLQKVKEMAVSDPFSTVRSQAIYRLTELEEDGLEDLMINILETEKSYNTFSAALNALYYINPAKTLELAETFKDETNYELISEISYLFSESKNPKYLSFFEEKIESMSGFDSYDVFSAYINLLASFSPEDLKSNLDFLILTGKNNPSSFKRFMATSGLFNLKEHVTSLLEIESKSKNKTLLQENNIIISKAIEEILKIEKDPQLLMRYEMF